MQPEITEVNDGIGNGIIVNSARIMLPSISAFGEDKGTTNSYTSTKQLILKDGLLHLTKEELGSCIVTSRSYC